MSILSTRVQASFKEETTVWGIRLFQSVLSFLGLLTGVLISDNFTGGFCDVGICLLRNDTKP